MGMYFIQSWFSSLYRGISTLNAALSLDFKFLSSIAFTFSQQNDTENLWDNKKEHGPNHRNMMVTS